MKSPFSCRFSRLCAALVRFAFGLALLAPCLRNHADTNHVILPGSTFTDDCPICDHVSIPWPMQGGFTLRLMDQGPFLTTFAVEDFQFAAGHDGGPVYHGSGSGTYEYGGDFALTHNMFLDLEVSDGATTNHALLQSNTTVVTNPFPTIRIELTQTNGSPTRTFVFDIISELESTIPFQVSASSSDHVTISWPETFGSATLFSFGSLSGLDPWIEIAPKAALSNGVYFATIPATNPASYFRLHSPIQSFSPEGFLPVTKESQKSAGQ